MPGVDYFLRSEVIFHGTEVPSDADISGMPGQAACLPGTAYAALLRGGWRGKGIAQAPARTSS